MSRCSVDRWLRWPLAACACAALIAAGCGGEETARLIDHLDELEFDLPMDTAKYVSFGRYDIPIAASRAVADTSAFIEEISQQGLVWMRLQFELTAETSPAHEQAVLAAAEARRGAVYDAVLTVVRSSTMDELADPRLGAVNAKLSEVVRPLLGGVHVRQLVLNDPRSVAAKSAAEVAAKKKAHGDGGHGEVEHGDAAHGDAKHGAAAHGDEAHAEGEHVGDAHGDEKHTEDAHGGH